MKPSIVAIPIDCITTMNAENVLGLATSATPVTAGEAENEPLASTSTCRTFDELLSQALTPFFSSLTYPKHHHHHNSLRIELKVGVQNLAAGRLEGATCSGFGFAEVTSGLKLLRLTTA